MHFECVDEAISAGDPALLKDSEGQACVRGCYRCLLSYFNQPDHELIDRTSEEARKFLVDLARGAIMATSVARPVTTTRDWPALFSEAGLPSADASGVTLAEANLPFAWRSHFVAATEREISSEVEEAARARGWTLFQLPDDPDAQLPPGLIAMLKE
jgi:hypothetical protein